MIFRFPPAVFDNPKFDQVINCQNIAEVGTDMGGNPTSHL